MTCGPKSVSVIVDRTGLSLSPLTLSDDATQPYWFNYEGIARPTFSPRYFYAPDSVWVSGKRLLGVVMDQGSLPLSLNAKGSSTADLNTKMAALEAAFFQFTYTVTLTIDGQSKTWYADPASVAWSGYEPVYSGKFLATASVSIPVNPS